MGLFSEQPVEHDLLEYKIVKLLKSGSIDPFNVATVKEAFKPYLVTIISMLDLANEHNINSRDAQENAVGMAGDAKRLFKDLEARRKKIVKAPNQFVKSVNRFVKSFVKPLSEIEEILKVKISQYTLKQELERREKEKKAQEAAAALQAAIDKEAKERGLESVTLAPMAVAEVDKVTRSDTGATMTTAKVWKATVVDPGSVPRKFCKPDDMLITEAVHAGLREIPGVKIWEDLQVKLRT